jgi:hypothetical protein
MSEVFDKIAQIEKLIEEIKGLIAVGSFKTPAQPTSDSSPRTKTEELPPVESAAPVMSELVKDGIDFDKVDYLKYGTVIKGKERLERKLWGEYDKILYGAGYKYSQPDQAWLFQPRDAKQEQSQPQKATPTTTKTTKVIRISNLNIDLKSPTIEGKLLDDPIQRDIDTARGPATVTNFRLDDGSGICRVSLWGELAESAMSLTAGMKVQITSLMVREPYDGMPQVSSGKWTKVIPL